MLNFTKTFIAIIASLAFLSGCGEISQQTADDIQKGLLNNDGTDNSEGELISPPEEIGEVEVKATALGSCVREYWAGILFGGYRDERCIDFKVEDALDNSQTLLLSSDTQEYCEDDLNGEYQVISCADRDSDFQEAIVQNDPEKNCKDIRDISDSVSGVEVQAFHVLVRNNRRLEKDDDRCRVRN